jgi:hypothetical protein
MSLVDVFAIPFTDAAFAAFNNHGRPLESLIRVAQSQAADLRATLRELISSHPAATKPDLTNLNKLKAVLAAIS